MKLRNFCLMLMAYMLAIISMTAHASVEAAVFIAAGILVMAIDSVRK